MKRLIIVLWSLAIIAVTPACKAGLDINGYANVVLPDLDYDPYQIGTALRSKARELGFEVYLALDEVPEAELPKTCYGDWGWRSSLVGGRMAIRLYDALTSNLVSEGTTTVIQWTSVSRAVKVGARKLWSKIPYSGFSARAYAANVQILFPPRPKLEIDINAFTRTAPASPVEGIWSDLRNEFRIAIVKASATSESHDYVGVILESQHALWEAGEIKIELNQTATPKAFVGNYYDSLKSRVGTTFLLEEATLLKFSVPDSEKHTSETALVKSWPPAERVATSSEDRDSKPRNAGSGFFLDTNEGLIGTNWHVVDSSEVIEVSLYPSGNKFQAQLVLRDQVNDLAILQLPGYDAETGSCTRLPYRLTNSRGVRLGSKVFVLGYPLSTFLGTAPRYTEGVVSSERGIEDDPRTFQISAEIQPGNSGGPLLDEKGNLVGVVIARLNDSKLFELTGSIPQNVNFAVKSDYLLNLTRMLPDFTGEPEAPSTDPSVIARCVVYIEAH